MSPLLPFHTRLTALSLTFTLAVSSCTIGVNGDSKLQPANAKQLKAIAAAEHAPKLSPRAKPLAKGKKTYVILQVDGGGIMGITPALVLRHLEQELQKRRPGFANKKLSDLFSICSGTSTGAIIAGLVTAGVKGDDVAKFYEVDGKALFQKKGKTLLPGIQPVYNRVAFQDTLYDILGTKSEANRRNQTLGDLRNKPLLLIAAYDLVSKRTHFLTNRTPADRPIPAKYDMQLGDAITCSSLSAALYFGKVPAPDVIWGYREADGTMTERKGAVYNDGGQATQNCTLFAAMQEAIRRGWGFKDDAQVVIISLGCGNNYAPNSYDNSARLSGGAQVFSFLFKNQARTESSLLQIFGADRIAQSQPNYKVFRFDFVPDRSSAFSINEAADKELHDKAKEIIARRDFIRLVEDLSNPEVIIAKPSARPDSAPAAASPDKMSANAMPLIQAF